MVAGSAEIATNEKFFALTESQSTYILLREVRRLAKPRSIILEIIEAQCDSYLNEDDIVRIKDKYGR